MDRRDLLRRFILLIDTLYFTHCNLVIEAAVDLDSLFAINGSASSIDIQKKETFDTALQQSEEFKFDEEFAYSRTLSRLKEMQTHEYQMKILE
jgi:predicted ATPase